MRESEVERYFVKRVKEVGGEQRKFISPCHKGVPDRLVAINGTMYLVELKAPGKFLRDDQIREHKRFMRVGVQPWTIDSKEGVDYFIEKVTA